MDDETPDQAEGQVEITSEQMELQVNLTAPEPKVSEVQVGGEDFQVRINSAAPLGEIVAAAERLYRLRGSAASSPIKAGFSLPVGDGRWTPDAPGSSNGWPAHQEVR